jgi:hypothetical protein
VPDSQHILNKKYYHYLIVTIVILSLTHIFGGKDKDEILHGIYKIILKFEFDAF